MSNADALLGERYSDPIELVPTSTRTGRVRLLARLSRAHQVAYETLVARVAPRIERSLSPAVIANRALPGPGVRLEPWREARRRFHHLVRTLTRSPGPIVVADIRDCYASIRPAVVASVLRRLGCDRVQTEVLGRLLSDFEDRGVSGLPVGPDPSAILANAVLASIDRALVNQGIPHVRWVDDLFMRTKDEIRARRVIDRLRVAASELGLGLAEEKTRIVEAEEITAGFVSYGGPT